MTRQERDQLIAIGTELREFRHNTEKSLQSLTDDVGTLMTAHNRQAGFIDAAKVGYGLIAAALALAGKWLLDNWHHMVNR